MKSVLWLVTFLACAVALGADVSEELFGRLKAGARDEVQSDYPEMKHRDSALWKLAAKMERDAHYSKSPDHQAAQYYDAPRYFADKAARRLGMAVVHHGEIVEPARETLTPDPWQPQQAAALAEVQKDYPEMKHWDSALWKVTAHLATPSDRQRSDQPAEPAADAPRYFVEKAARLLGMAVVRRGVVVEPAVTQRRAARPPPSSPGSASSAGSIGEAKIDAPKGYLAVWEYPILTHGEPGGTAGVDPRFLFQAYCNELDEGITWTLEIIMLDAGQDAAPRVTSQEYLALIEQCLDRFLHDVPGAKVESVGVYLTEDSAILADARKELRPLFEDMKRRSLAGDPKERSDGKAIQFPEHSTSTFVRAANASTTVQKLAAKMASRLGREYLYVTGWGDPFVFGHNGEFYGKSWDVLLQDPYLGIAPMSMKLYFVYGPQPEPGATRASNSE